MTQTFARDLAYDNTASELLARAPGGASRIKVTLDHGYDITGDIQRARALPGYAGDSAKFNAIAATRRDLCWRPELGGLIVEAPLRLPLTNSRVKALGGTQAAAIVRTAGNTQSTMIVGLSDGTSPAGGFVAENIWFTHAGRLLYSSGALANRLTADQSHLEIWQGQAARIINCGGYGMPHFMSLFACGGAQILNLATFGGVWNPLRSDAQEGVSQIRLASSTLSHNVNIEIISPEMYGGNTLGVQSRTIGTKTVQARMHCGPLSGLLVESAECWAVRGGFFAGYAQGCVTVRARNTYDILMRGLLNGTFIDECNGALVYTGRTGAAYPLLDGLDLQGCGLNGQIIGTHGAAFSQSSDNLPSVRRVKISDSQFRAFLGGGVYAQGVDGLDIQGSEFAGYNLADNIAPVYASGVYLGSGASNVHLRNCQFGGGQNDYAEPYAVDGTSGLTLNGCMYGAYGDTGSSGDYAYLRARNLAKPGGALVSGTLTAATA